jgi:hypothetical protein
MVGERMKTKWKPTREQMKKYYQREKDKPSFKRRRRESRMAAYRNRRALGLCVINGCTEETWGRAYCPEHADKAYASNRKSRAKARKARETR